MARSGLLLALFAAALVVCGCADAGSGGVVLVALVAALGIAGCRTARAEPDAAVVRLDAFRDTSDVRSDAGADSGSGHCEPCCGYAADFGYCGTGTYSCWCPAGISCNYAWGCLADTGPAPREEPCCVFDAAAAIGTLTTCFCPGHAACGFSFVDCGDGTCTIGDGGACPTDAGSTEAGAPDVGD